MPPVRGTGRLFAHERDSELVPDVVTIARAFGGGLPPGALLLGAKAAESLRPVSHGSTFGASSIAPAVAHVVVRKLRHGELLANVERQGERLRSRPAALHNKIGFITGVPGKGLVIGTVLHAERAGRAEEPCQVCRRHGIPVLRADSHARSAAI